MSIVVKCMTLALLVMVSTSRAATVVFAREPNALKRWAFDYGVAFITSENISELMSGTLNIDDGPAGGEIHHFTAAYLLAEPEWNWFGRSFQPALELPLTLSIVDENGSSPFACGSFSFNVRWRQFPWNERVRTSFSMGLGLSYSSRVYAMDEQRHPDDDRSKWKFNWPIQMTFAHPSHPQHQLLLFLAHQSGGRVFDRGGVNSLGFGYRFASW